MEKILPFSFRQGSGWVALAAFNSHAGLLLKTPSSTIIFDPISIDPAAFVRVDTIIITHEHWDHLDISLITDIQSRTSALVLTTPFVSQLLREIPSSKVIAMEPGDLFSHSGIRFNALASLHPGYQPLAFLITTQEGVKFYHPSDSDPFPEMDLLATYPRVDILIYLGDSLRKAVHIAKLVQPTTILCRYINKEALSVKSGALVKHLNQHEVSLYTASDKSRNLPCEAPTG